MCTITRPSDKSSGTDNQIPRLSTDEIHHLLQSERRRLILEELYEHGQMRKSDLVDRLAIREYGESVRSQKRKRIAVGIHQHHLPALEDHNVIKRTRDGIELTDNASQLVGYLDNASVFDRLQTLF